MKYAVIKVINGNYFVHAEGITDVNAALVSFSSLWTTLLNAPDVITAQIMIVDENLDCVDGNKKFISHPVTE